MFPPSDKEQPYQGSRNGENHRIPAGDEIADEYAEENAESYFISDSLFHHFPKSLGDNGQHGDI